MYFITACADHTQEFDYGRLLHRGLGRGVARAVLCVLVLFPLSSLVSYARVVADAIPPVLQDFLGASGFVATDVCWLIIGGVVFFAISCRRTLNELFISSIFGVATIMFAVLVVVIRFFDGSYAVPRRSAGVPADFQPAYMNVAMFKTIPVICFALSVHNNAPHYYQELENRTPAKMMHAFYVAHAIVVAAYATMGTFGLLTFGVDRLARANGNILNAFSNLDALVNVARLLMFVHFVAVYPILLMATRRGFNNLVFGSRWLPMRTLIIETGVIVLLSCVIAYVAPNIDTVLSISGSVFGSIVIMIVPSSLYLRLVGGSVSGTALHRGLAMFSIGYGVLVGVLGLVVTVADPATKPPPLNTTRIF